MSSCGTPSSGSPRTFPKMTRKHCAAVQRHALTDSDASVAAGCPSGQQPPTHPSQEFLSPRLDIRESPPATAHHHPTEAALAASQGGPTQGPPPRPAISAPGPAAHVKLLRQPVRSPDCGKPLGTDTLARGSFGFDIGARNLYIDILSKLPSDTE